MIRSILFLLGGMLFLHLDAATHIFWYKAIERGYNLLQVNPGPGIPAGGVVHQGMAASGTYAQNSGTQNPAQAAFGSGLNDALGLCSFFWFLDLDSITGTVTNAKLRGEFKDGWCTYAACNAGPIQLRCGVVDFQGNLSTWGGAGLVPETADWQDYLNPLGYGMGANATSSQLGAEEIIPFTAPAGRPSTGGASVLDGKFFEIDVTDQVNYILSNPGNHAIVLLGPIGQGSTGKVTAYADEKGASPTGACTSNNPWTTDGNTVHLWVESSNLAYPAPDTTPPVISGVNPLPEPFAVTFKWSTSEPATSQIYYGTGGNFNLEHVVIAFRTVHSVYVGGLSTATLYNYRLVSRDASGNSETSGVHYFTTDRPPSFVSTPLTLDTLAAEDSLYSEQLAATDPDSADTRTFSLLTAPAGLSITPSTGALSWTPANGQGGRHLVRAKVADKFGLSDTLTFYISVANVNDPPLIQSSRPSGDTAISEGDTLLLSISAVDPDAGDVLTYFWFRNGTPSGNSSLYIFGTGLSSSGVDTVRVLVFDGKAQSEKTWKITIANRSIPPTVLFPSNGKAATGDTLLGWGASPDPEIQGSQFFRIQFSKSSAFSEILLEEQGIQDTALRLRDLKGIVNLPSGFIIFWRVMAYDTAGYQTAYTPGSNYFVYLGSIGVETAFASRMPAAFFLGAVTPNPVRSRARVAFEVPPGGLEAGGGPVSLKLFDVRGHCIRVLSGRAMAPGYHSVDFISSDLGAGVYVVRMKARGFVEARRIVLVK